MAKKNFKRISRGYREGYDYVGFGWTIEKENIWGEIWYYIFFEEDCKYDEDGRLDVPYKDEWKKFESLKEAKEYCMSNPR